MMMVGWGLYAARASGRTLLLPPVMQSRRRLARQFWANSAPRDTETSGWFPVPLGRVVDVPYLVACAARAGVAVELAGPSSPPPPTAGVDAGFIRFQRDIASRIVASTAPIVEYQTIFNGGNPGPLEKVQLLALDACLAWAPHLLAASALLAQGALGQWGAPLVSAVAVHARLEDDLIEVFAGDPHNAGEVAAVVNRIAEKIIRCMGAVAPPAAAAARGTRFVVLTADPLSHPKYGGLEAAYPGLLTTKEGIAPEVTAQVEAAQGLDGGAAVLDFNIATEASVFVGYAGSSFSQRVAQDRLRRGRPSYLYNEADKAFSGCAAVTDPWRVVYEDGSYTELLYVTEDDPGEG
jgi:hypothetical protein